MIGRIERMVMPVLIGMGMGKLGYEGKEVMIGLFGLGDGPVLSRSASS